MTSIVKHFANIGDGILFRFMTHEPPTSLYWSQCGTNHIYNPMLFPYRFIRLVSRFLGVHTIFNACIMGTPNMRTSHLSEIKYTSLVSRHKILQTTALGSDTYQVIWSTRRNWFLDWLKSQKLKVTVDYPSTAVHKLFPHWLVQVSFLWWKRIYTIIFLVIFLFQPYFPWPSLYHSILTLFWFFIQANPTFFVPLFSSPLRLDTS